MCIEIDTFNELKNKFERIKRMGWIKSKTSGLGGIGDTFEQLLGINQNELEIPDYNGIEIKTKRSHSNSNTSLFNCVPNGPHYHEVERLKDRYGYPDSKLKMYNVLNTSICTTEITKVGLYYYFKIKVDKEKEKVFLQIYDKSYKLIEEIVYWDFDILEEKLLRKLKYMAFIKGISKKVDGDEYFKYYKLTFYELKDFDTFIKLLERGIIKITFKLGIYRWGIWEGRIHDHGTSFNINENDFEKLYKKIE